MQGGTRFKPSAGEVPEKKLQHKEHAGLRSGTADNMFLVFLITFAASASNYEKYVPEQAGTAYSTVLWTVCVLTWILLSFICGYRRKWQFEVFTAVYWILPAVLIFLADSGPKAFRFSLIMYSLSEFSSLIMMQPVYMLSSLFGIGETACMVIIIAACLVCFGAGLLTNINRDKLKRLMPVKS
ncbi:MAG: hypothetical protein ACI4XF_08590 [Oscillospiraceae bacterium]